MFVQNFTVYGDLNDRFLQNVYFASNKSIFEIYKLTENNQVFKFLIQNEIGKYVTNELSLSYRLNN